MRLKTVCRTFGAYQAGIFGWGYSWSSNLVNNINYKGIPEFFLGDQPIENKVLAGAYLATINFLVPVTALAFVDGLSDLVKGTHHYFGCTLIKLLEKDANSKKEIDDELENQLMMIERS